MKGQSRNVVIAIVIAALVGLNVWRWWPASQTAFTVVNEAGGKFNLDEFDVKAIPVDTLPPVSRDIFRIRRVEPVKPRITSAVATPPPPVKSPEELEKEGAQAELAQLQCVGISIRNEHAHAYLISGGEPLLVSNGDRVGHRFIVEKIGQDGVMVRDSNTGVGGLVPLSGKK